jgi:hypothetical protein
MKSIIFPSLFIGGTILITILFIHYLTHKPTIADCDTINEIIQTMGVILLCFHYSISYAEKKYD